MSPGRIDTSPQSNLRRAHRSLADKTISRIANYWDRTAIACWRWDLGHRHAKKWPPRSAPLPLLSQWTYWNWFRHFEDISRRCEPRNVVAYFFGPPCRTSEVWAILARYWVHCTVTRDAMVRLTVAHLFKRNDSLPTTGPVDRYASLHGAAAYLALSILGTLSLWLLCSVFADPIDSMPAATASSVQICQVGWRAGIRYDKSWNVYALKLFITSPTRGVRTCAVMCWACLFVCLSVCLSISSHIISEITRPNFTNFAACGRGSVHG